MYSLILGNLFAFPSMLESTVVKNDSTYHADVQNPLQNGKLWNGDERIGHLIEVEEVIGTPRGVVEEEQNQTGRQHDGTS